VYDQSTAVCTAERVNCVEERTETEIQVISFVHFSRAGINNCTLAINFSEAIPLCESDLYNTLCTVNTQHTSNKMQQLQN